MVFADHSQLQTFSAAQKYLAQGRDYERNGDIQHALDAYERAINADPGCHEAFAAGGRIFADQNRRLEAADCFACAVRACPENHDYKRRFMKAMEGYQFAEKNDNIRGIILLCLQTENLPLSDLAPHWLSDLKLDPDYKKTPVMPDAAFLTDPFFLEGLKKLVICDPDFETFLTALRANLLKNHKDKDLALITALAHYAFNTEYIFALTPEEKNTYKALKTDTPVDLAMRACYEPLFTLPDAEKIAGQHKDNADLKTLLDLQITQPLAQRKLAQTIETLTPVRDDVSQAVRDQYEEFPYPRWTYMHDEIKDEETEGRFKDKAAQILVAGCGTGQEAVELACVFPDAQILAVDLSRASLAYGLSQANRLKIENITFKQADILNLHTLETRFDYIASSGVLHHMKEPGKGLAVLTDLLKPGGLMRLALYSEKARAAIVKARAAIAENTVPGTVQGIRNFRAQARKLVGAQTQKDLQKFRDYYYTSECRDLIFHVQEHRFTIPQIKTLLEANNLDFLKFYLPQSDEIRYRKMFSNHAPLSNLDNWDAYEQKHPQTFINMYKFWAGKAP